MHSQARRRSSLRCGVFLILLLAAVSGAAQVRATVWQHAPDYTWGRLFLRHSPFPHPSRDNGYAYQENAADSTTKKYFPRHPHYDDSTAIVVIPRGYHLVGGGNELIIHFHGWWNGVDSVMKAFGMVPQLIASRKNAILVLAQGPYRAPDSRGGKMEDEAGCAVLSKKFCRF